MRVVGDTHPGRVHEQNEDSIGWDLINGLVFVADGMGGHAAGEVASSIAREKLLERAAAPLTDAILEAHHAIVRTASENAEQRGMGSTVVALRLDHFDGEVVWVGDSRAYLWRHDELRALTRDHSFLELLLMSKKITEVEARNHPKRNLVTQTLGIGEPAPEREKVSLQPGDWVMLCSAGLNDELTDVEMAAILRSATSPEAAVKQLIDAAVERGGRDNISVVIVEPDARSSLWRFGAYFTDLWTRVPQTLRPAIVGALGGVLLALVLWTLRQIG
jgi:PPM family protein phosphatase